MTHCQARPISISNFQYFFFHKSKDDLLNDFVLCFNNFSKEIKAQKIEIINFSYHKNVHFAWTNAQVFHKNQIPI